jgi:hypothetical protein
MESKFSSSKSLPMRRVQLAVDESARRTLRKLESRVADLVKGRLMPEETSGRPVENRRKLTTDEYTNVSATIEYGPKKRRVTKYYDRRPSETRRFSRNPREIDYESLVPPGGERPLEGSMIHAFVDLAVYIRYGSTEPAVDFGITPKLLHLYLVKDGGAARPGGTGGIDLSVPIPVSMKRLRELGIAGEHDVGSSDDDEDAVECFRSKAGAGGGLDDSDYFDDLGDLGDFGVPGKYGESSRNGGAVSNKSAKAARGSREAKAVRGSREAKAVRGSRAPVNPVKPVKNMENVENEESLEKKEPLDPEKSGEPLDPEESGEPLDPEESGEPLDPEESGEPLDPEKSGEPLDPEESGDPHESARPIDRGLEEEDENQESQEFRGRPSITPGGSKRARRGNAVVESGGSDDDCD